MVAGGPETRLTVRRALPDEDAELADLFNRAHDRFTGVAVRSAGDLAWRYRRRPGVSDEGSILVEDQHGSLLGYAFIDDRGDVLELAVEPEGPRRAAATALITACEARARATGATRIRLNVPIVDAEVADALASAGMASSAPDRRLYVSGTDPHLLVEMLAAGMAGEAPVGVVEIVVRDPLPWQPARSSVRLREAPGPSLAIRCDRRTLNDVLLGGASLWLRLLAGRLQIRPWRMTLDGIRLVRMLRLRAVWFHTLGDIL